MMNSEDGIERFLEAQASHYPIALAEIQSGQKQSHWIWYIFPQLAHTAGFPSQSEYNRYYGIKGLAEAKVYWANSTLKSRLIEITTAVLQSGQRNPEILMGSYVDARKLRSCMTLFAAVAPEETIFAEVLDTLYDGQRCEWSSKQLQEELP